MIYVSSTEKYLGVNFYQPPTNNLCQGKALICNNVKTAHYDTETISYLAMKIWQLIPDTIKNTDSLNMFQRNIKMWIPTACPCKLCNTYIQYTWVSFSFVYYCYYCYYCFFYPNMFDVFFIYLVN